MSHHTTTSAAAVPGRTELLSTQQINLIFAALVLAGVIYSATHLLQDLAVVQSATGLTFVLLAAALAISLGFEFVNGFHDTANAVATVIYTHSLPPAVAVVWSGFWNFAGVLVSSGAVAYGIVSLLPVELILQVGNGGGTAMVFALLIAAIVWNLATWYFGIPSSSSHALIGSIVGVGLTHQLLTPGGQLDWSHVLRVGQALLFSPVIGFTCAALLLLLAKRVLTNRELYEEPKGARPPPPWIRGLLILTCTGVSFAHGSNDGQKGTGLIMLILVGIVPAAYALNRSLHEEEVRQFAVASDRAMVAIGHYADAPITVGDPRGALAEYVGTRKLQAATLPALKTLIVEVRVEMERYGSFAKVPTARVSELRNDIYLLSESLRLIAKSGQPKLSAPDKAAVAAYREQVDAATKYIPTWVKLAVAIALGVGTMFGWKRVVVTVGERIGKSHLTYAQGASAELVAASTIGAADLIGLPVSTTHVVSSGIAGTMTANGSGVQWTTVRNILLTWVFTLPATILFSGGLYWVFRQF